MPISSMESFSDFAQENNISLGCSYTTDEFFDNSYIVIIYIPEQSVETFQNSQFAKYAKK